MRCPSSLTGRLAALAAALTLASAPSARAAFVNITFDAGGSGGALAVGSVLSNQYAAFGVTFSPNAFTGPGGPTGSWATNTNMTVVSSTGGDVGGLGTPGLVSGNLLRSFNGWLAENGDPSFVATFSTPVSTLSADFAGVAFPSSTRLFAYNGATLLTAATATTLTGQQTLTVSSATPITSVRFTPGDFFDWVGVDNIRFNTIETVAVPEPASLTALVLGGATAAGVIRRRRRAAG